MARLNVSLGDEQKDRWENHLENDLPGVNTMSELVRKGVESYIADSVDDESESVPADLNDTVAELNDTLDELESEISEAKDQAKLARVEQISEEELETIVFEEASYAAEDIIHADVIPRLDELRGVVNEYP